jgi:hypothetical protein
MTDPPSRNARLSPHRAFVVQFAEETQLEAGQMVGRVEHVVSGQATHFDSLDALLAFLARVLREVGEPRRRTPRSDGEHGVRFALWREQCPNSSACRCR